MNGVRQGQTVLGELRLTFRRGLHYAPSSRLLQSCLETMMHSSLSWRM